MSNKRASRIASRLMPVLSVLLTAVLITAPVNATTKTDLVGPTGSGSFGTSVTVLPNGNFVVTDPDYYMGSTFQVGAVYLYNGAILELISTLTGSTRSDSVGWPGVQVLSNGNFVVNSQNWQIGAVDNAGLIGAVTWCSGTTGCNGPVTLANSLVGTRSGDSVPEGNVRALSNGNYVVSSPNWSNGAIMGAGAVTLCSGTGGCTGSATATNSLVGSQAGDGTTGGFVQKLSNGNYVVMNRMWDNGAVTDAGAVTWCSGTTGCSGPVTTENSLVGTHTNDQVGNGFVIPLSNGNYVIISKMWDNGAVTDAGAVTWCSGTGGCSGPVTTTNSLVGTQTNDKVGWDGLQILSNGNYVIISTMWDNGLGTDAGAVTWCSGTSGCSGPVTTTNSLVGTHTNDQVGTGRVLALSNGNYVVPSDYWSNGALTGAGAVTWCSGTSGCTGPVTTTNSLVGTQAGDNVGYWGAVALSNGNYVVGSWRWNNGAVTGAGAVTWCSGTSGCSGPVTTTNSLVGTQMNDKVGYYSVLALSNGNYVVGSPYWDKGAVTDAGAVTWCSGISGCSGPVTTTNSLVGTQAGDQVSSASALSNGNYVVSSIYWDNGVVTDAGAVTWCGGTSGCSGPVTTANSLVGTQMNDKVGYFSASALSNGNYVVISMLWDNGAVTDAGAVTWCNGTSGCSGPVTTSNSLVGTQADDRVGEGGVRALSNGGYVVTSRYWDNGAVTNAGAITWGDGIGGTTTGPLTDQNSVLGKAVYGGSMNFTYDGYSGHLLVGRPEENKVTVVFLVSNKYIYLPFVIK